MWPCCTNATGMSSMSLSYSVIEDIREMSLRFLFSRFSFYFSLQQLKCYPGNTNGRKRGDVGNCSWFFGFVPSFVTFDHVQVGVDFPCYRCTYHGVVIYPLVHSYDHLAFRNSVWKNISCRKTFPCS